MKNLDLSLIDYNSIMTGVGIGFMLWLIVMFLDWLVFGEDKETKKVKELPIYKESIRLEEQLAHWSEAFSIIEAAYQRDLNESGKPTENHVKTAAARLANRFQITKIK